MKHLTIHAIGETLPVIPTVVRSPCGKFFYVDKERDSLTEDPASITCPACLHALTLRPQAPRNTA
jgi:hypothetical protein